MGYFGRHFRKVARRMAAAGLATAATAPAVASEETEGLTAPAPVPAPVTVPSWTVSAPNRPALVVRAENESAARKAARESWGLTRLPNGATVAAV